MDGYDFYFTKIKICGAEREDGCGAKQPDKIQREGLVNYGLNDSQLMVKKQENNFSVLNMC